MKRISMVAICLTCAGCVVFNKPGGSLDTLEASRADAADLAEQTAEILSVRYTPAHTSLSLDKAPGAYGEALEARLRARGFSLVPPGTKASHPVIYTVGVLEEEELPQGYVRVSHGKGQHFSFTRPLSLVADPQSSLPDQEQTVIEEALRESGELSEESAAIVAAALPADVQEAAPRATTVSPSATAPAAPHSEGEESGSVLAAVEPAPVLSSPIWEIRQGKMLRDQMESWAREGGYSLIWNVENDYEMTSSATFPGDFIEAVKAFFATLQANGLALRVTVYQGNRVVEISEF